MYNNIKQKLSDDRGITLISLVITVIVMLIIVSVSINFGTKSLDNTKLKGFYTELEIIQKRIDDIATTNESYIDDNGNTVYLREQGVSFENLDTAKQAKIEGILLNEGAELGLSVSSFKYFTSEELETTLGLLNMKYNVFVDFETRTIVAEEGITINGVEYHILINDVYITKQDTTKNERVITLSYSISNYGAKNYKVVVTPSNALGNGILKYKKSTSKYWETSNNLEIVIDELALYDIMYEDSNKNFVSETIKIELNENGNPTIAVNE